MKKLLILLISAVLLAACAPKTPRTLDKFRHAIEHKNRVIRETVLHEVKRPFEKVYRDIKAQSEKCMSMRIDQTRKGLIFDKKTYYIYSAVTKRTGKGKATMALIWGHEEYRDSFPEKDVWYKLIADIESIGKNRTRVSIYGTYFDSEPYNAIKAYAEGRKYRFCPPQFY